MASRGADLEGVLLLVGRELDYPPATDLAPLVRGAVEREPHRRPLFRLPRLRLPVLRPPAVFRPAWQAVVAAVVAFAVLLSGVLASSPGARHAVAGWFGLGAVHIVVTPAPSTPPPERPLGHGLDLGRRTTLAKAQQHLGTKILLPANLGQPDEVYVRDYSLTGAQVFLVYRERPGLPKASATGVGLLLGEFTGDISREAMDKFTEGATLEVVRVDDTNGFWIEHGHAVGYADRRGQMVADDLRLAGNVLLWEQGRLTLRIESAMSKAEAIRLADTIHP
jgi:hypothetical protein